MELIDKAAVVAMIKRHIKEEPHSYFCKCLLSEIDTIEVKGVDLDYIKDELDRAVKIYKPDGDFGWGTLYNIAIHFFELGLKARKGE